MLVGVVGSGFFVSVPGNCCAFLLVRQIVINFGKKIFPALKIDKILSRFIAVGKICLIIGEKETTCTKNIKGTKGNAAFNASQTDIQIDFGCLEHIRCHIIIIHRTVIDTAGKC